MNNHQESEQFTVLENKKIGRNLALFRKLRDRKAMEVAEYIGIGEAAYTKYERGETRITIEIIQKVAEFLKVDPITLITESPVQYVENGSHSTNSHNSVNKNYYYHGADKEMVDVMIKLMENMMTISQKIIETLEKSR